MNYPPKFNHILIKLINTSFNEFNKYKVIY